MAAAALAAIGVVLAGCAAPAVSGDTKWPTAPAGRVVEATHGGAGSDGLTLRYQAADGSIKIIHVEDFRR